MPTIDHFGARHRAVQFRWEHAAFASQLVLSDHVELARGAKCRNARNNQRKSVFIRMGMPVFGATLADRMRPQRIVDVPFFCFFIE